MPRRTKESPRTARIVGNSVPNYEVALHKRAVVLKFTFVAKNKSVDFSAYITDYNENFNSNWKKTEVYGRLDPIANYQGTTRTLSLGFELPAQDLAQAQHNLLKLSELITYLYPVMDNSKSVGNINTPPMLRLKFANLIERQSNAPISHHGLLGFVDGAFSITPMIEEGIFIDAGDNKPTHLYPQAYKLSFTYTALHEHRLGWETFEEGEDDPNRRPINFPYGVPGTELLDFPPPTLDADPTKTLLPTAADGIKWAGKVSDVYTRTREAIENNIFNTTPKAAK